MIKCTFCGAPLSNNEPMCEYCNMYNKEQIEQKQTTTQNKGPSPEEKKVSKILSILSLIIVIPMYVISFNGAISIDEMTFPAGLLAMVMLYSMTIGIIPHIIGIILSIISLKKDKTNIIAKISFTITILPYAILIGINLFGSIIYHITK